MLKTMKLVYKNMVVDRSKPALFGLIVLALLTTTNLYFNAKQFGNVTADVMTFLALVAWFVVLPMVFTLIDTYKSPQRLEKIWNETKK